MARSPMTEAGFVMRILSVLLSICLAVSGCAASYVRVPAGSQADDKTRILVGDTVKLRLSDGKKVEGRVTSLDEASIEIRRRAYAWTDVESAEKRITNPTGLIMTSVGLVSAALLILFYTEVVSDDL